MTLDAERQRLLEDQRRESNWKRWGPYLSERQWGTVREDYSADGSCWSYLPHDHARSRAYRWGEDGLLGICDRECRLCFCLAFWNERDPILKERLFGLGGPEGNHGEDVKELYYYLSSSPTHSYMKALYKYPQQEFPYKQLVEESKRRDKLAPEYEITDTGVFEEDRYFDCFIEYAKETANNILIRLTIVNRGPVRKPIHILPTLWFRNTWSWGRVGEAYSSKPSIKSVNDKLLALEQETLGNLFFEAEQVTPVLFTENESNLVRLYNTPTNSPWVKDSFHSYIIGKQKHAVNQAQVGTKAAFHYALEIDPQQQKTFCFRLYANNEVATQSFGKAFEQTFNKRIEENMSFYESISPNGTSADERLVMRQAYAGLLWSKQFYYYSVREWAEGDPSQPAPDAKRKLVRNKEWHHLYNRDIISMPDKWEYPWYAAWDLAFHMLPFCKIDPEFAKSQLLLFLREWYMHPNGQIPAYEFAFGDVNPPVHAWACWRVYKITGAKGKRDRAFLKRAFQKLLINFTWWVNRKDLEGNNLFAGGFLGLDNIGVFDRSQPLPVGGQLAQADGTAWMAFYCATMLSMALELASEDPTYEDMASKFFEHFISIIDAINNLAGSGLWDEQDGFYYDQLHVNGETIPLRVRSLVGVIPALAVEVLEDQIIEKLPGFSKRMRWFIEHRQDLARNISYMESGENRDRGLRLLAVPSRQRLERMLRYILNESEFLSSYGIRSLSKVHQGSPYVFHVGAQQYRVDYVPGESTTAFFGGNSNWRGPVWFPINYILIEALERYHHFYGDSLKVECPTGSGNWMNLRQVSQELAERHVRLFALNSEGMRPVHGTDARYKNSAEWQDLVLFYEYFHGETGKGLGASHQTGWTALVTRCIEKLDRSWKG